MFRSPAWQAYLQDLRDYRQGAAERLERQARDMNEVNMLRGLLAAFDDTLELEDELKTRENAESSHR